MEKIAENPVKKQKEKGLSDEIKELLFRLR